MHGVYGNHVKVVDRTRYFETANSMTRERYKIPKLYVPSNDRSDSTWLELFVSNSTRAP